MKFIMLISMSISTITVAFTPLVIGPSSSSKRMALKVVNGQSSSSLSAFVHASASDDEEPKGSLTTLRATMRKSTGISLTAIRAAMRAATGVSLTAMYLSVFGFTSQWVRDSMKFVLSLFPPSVSSYISEIWELRTKLFLTFCEKFRYFLQPFLVLYYAPLFMLRTWTSPQLRRERRDLKTALRGDWDRSFRAADIALKISGKFIRF